ncbi:UCP2 [Branchiostoma lanceolatum]|uniref:UCP2 protein n=1 Tax=Branchiostoma lanceolatum TaxID=7740 RepID=A0A8J9ZBS3_BRALA|nr:UCP2 [Branchiostoma lanceolatum]
MGIGFKPLDQPPTVGVRFFAAGFAACIADGITFPLDTAKVRLQIQGEGSAAAATTAPRLTTLCTSTMAAQFDMAAGPFNAQNRGLSGTIVCIVKQEGPKGLYSGLVAGLHRQMSFASIRIGLYDSVKTFYQKQLRREKDGASMPTRIMAGITTGAIAVSCAQPTDVVKVRMQAEGADPFAGKKRYTGALSAYRTIAREEGMKGLWKGTGPNIARNSIVNATELVCYDMVKEEILAMNLMTDNLPCHFTSAFITGFVTTCVASPVDVVKTRFMNSRPGQYTGALDCAMKMFYEGGPMAFYKGFTPSFMRLGSWNILMFVFYEQLKRGFTHLNQQNRYREVKAPI